MLRPGCIAIAQTFAHSHTNGRSDVYRTRRLIPSLSSGLFAGRKGNPNPVGSVFFWPDIIGNRPPVEPPAYRDVSYAVTRNNLIRVDPVRR